MPVAARFHALRDQSAQIVDGMFAEPVRLFFFKNGAPDLSRPSLDIEAPLPTGGGKSTSADGGRSRAWRSKIAAGKAELHIDRARYPALEIRTGDKVLAMSRLGEPMFEVLRVDDRSANRLIVELGEI